MKELAGKTAVVSGGAEGIGFGIALTLGHQRMNIVLTDINEDRLQAAEASPLLADVVEEEVPSLG